MIVSPSPSFSARYENILSLYNSNGTVQLPKVSKTLQYLKKILYNGRWVFDRKSIFNPRLHCSKSRENGIIFYGIVVELLFIESWVLKFCHIALLKSATLANGYVFLLWPASFFKRKMQFPWERGR